MFRMRRLSRSGADTCDGQNLIAALRTKWHNASSPIRGGVAAAGQPGGLAAFRGQREGRPIGRRLDSDPPEAVVVDMDINGLGMIEVLLRLSEGTEARRALFVTSDLQVRTDATISDFAAGDTA